MSNVQTDMRIVWASAKVTCPDSLAGGAIDTLGTTYGLTRLEGENDNAFRQRVFQAVLSTLVI